MSCRGNAGYNVSKAAVKTYTEQRENNLSLLSLGEEADTPS